DYGRPLQLLARNIGFTDPLSRRDVEYRSRLELSGVPAAKVS
ncbi:MAG TPA: pseudouridine synthase, partial [Micrococcaceae bacterium]|nr:pseudouridine synthase [Micrococcaceae bacterium]